MNNLNKKRISRSKFLDFLGNNRFVHFLIIVLFILIDLLLFSKASFIINPIVNFIGIITLPVVISGMFYYLLNPIVNFLERHRINRLIGTIIVFLLLILLIVWGVMELIPSINNFINHVPDYTKEGNKVVNNILQDDRFKQYRPQIEKVVNNFNTWLIDSSKDLSTNLLTWTGNVFSAAAQVVISVLIAPFILFYLLRDGRRLKTFIEGLLPIKWRSSVINVLEDMNSQLSNYIRGQVTVAIIVAIIFSILFSIVGLRFAITLGIVAGILNLIPYLGSFLAMIPAFILAIVAGPVMIVKVAIAFLIEQTIEGRLVSPLILGSQLDIHPITILFVLLTAGKMYGVWGVLLGVPVYAVLKVLVTEIFRWYKKSSGLY